MNISITLIFTLFTFINSYGQELRYDEKEIYKTKFDDAVPVLNVATWHFGETSDANSTEFDENDKSNQKEVKKLAKLLAEFRPTIIVIENSPKNDSLRQISYFEYLKNPKMKFEKPTEIELLAYEVGRLSGAKKIYGIDFKESYNYNISVNDNVDKTTANKYWKLSEENETKNPENGIEHAPKS